jgi:uncharacterized protein YkwD
MKTLVTLSAGGATPFLMLNANVEAVYYSLTGRAAFVNLTPVPDRNATAFPRRLTISITNERIPQMKARVVGLMSLCFAVVLLCSFTADEGHSQTSKSLTFSGLSQAEQELLNEINLARANPQTYVAYLEKLKPSFSGKEYKSANMAVTTQEGWTAVEDAIAFLKAAKPVGPLSMSKGLSLAATIHVKEQGGSGATGHKSGTQGGYIEVRAKLFGSWQGAIGENLSYGPENARERLLTWLIDDGFASRGHRKRLMSADYGVAGVSCGPHPEFTTMCALALAGGFSDANTAPVVNKPVTTKTRLSNTNTKSNTNSNLRKM